MSDASGLFSQFQHLCNQILGESSHNGKTKLIKDFLPSWHGDLFLLCKLLLIKEDQRVFNLREKSLTKLLSQILKCPHNDMLLDLQKGDLAATACKFYESHNSPPTNSILTLKQVDRWLDKLTTLTKEEEQMPHLSSLLSVATSRDLNFVCRLIDKDLKINIGAKFVLAALHPQAFDAYRNTHNLKSVVDKVLSHSLDTPTKAKKSANSEVSGDEAEEAPVPKLTKGLSVGLQLGTPIKPMLARACKSFDEAWKRCPRGMYVEIKYDGERVQVHKQGNNFQFFSRNLKSVKANKVEGLADLLTASSSTHSFILDGEVLVVDKVTLKMLPFGALGIHKQKQFPNAQLCYFIFDIMHLDGKTLLEVTYEQRRQMLLDNFTLVSGKLALSDAREVKNDDELQTIWKRVLTENLEGLMLKDKFDTYKPNQRHWLKLKKDYLAGMADSADLIVLGAYYGSGNKGGLLTTYLCCVFDPVTKNFKTTCKASGGLDDATLAALQPKTMSYMTKINGDLSKVPPWLAVSKMHCPDWVAKDPKTAPVWEIEGASFSISSNHTANGISIRFPRITKFRDDKDWSTATTLLELEELAMNSPDFVAAREMKGLPAPSTAGMAAKKKNAAAAAAASSMPGLFSVGDTSTLSSGKKIGVTGITYVVGDVTTTMLGDGASNRLIIMATDGSKWPVEEQVIVDKWPNVLKAFNKNKDGIEPGSALLVKTPIPEHTGITRLGVIVCINPHTQSFLLDAMSSALEELLNFSRANGVASFHFIWPTTLKGIAWGQLELKLKTHLVDVKCPVFVYNRNPITGVTWKSKPKKKGLIVHDSDDEGSEGDPEDNMMEEEDDNEEEEAFANPSGSSTFLDTSAPTVGIPPPFSTDPNDIFSGKSILTYGIPNVSELQALVMCDGGWFASAESTAVNPLKYTHVLTENAWDPTIEGWLRANPTVKVVRPSWVLESSEKGKCVYEKPHFVSRVK